MKRTSVRWSVAIGLILMNIGAALGQPVWEDISPIPGHEVAYLSEHVTLESGMWACVCGFSGLCYTWEFRPYFSSDGGTSWELRDGGLPEALGVLAVAVNPRNPRRLLASTAGTDSVNLGPWLSTDQGLSWRAVWEEYFAYGPVDDHWMQSGWFSDGVHAWFVDEILNRGGVLWLSADSGQTWADSTFEPSGEWLSFMPHPQISAIGWLGAFFAYRTTDFGHTWTRCPYSGFCGYVFGDVGPGEERAYANALYTVGRPGHLHYVALNVLSVDTGQTWNFLNPADTVLWDEPRQQIFDVLLDPLRPGHLLGLTYDTLFESVDDGQTWSGVIGDTTHMTWWFGYEPSLDWLYSAGYCGQGCGGIWRWRRQLGVGLEHSQSSGEGPTAQVCPNPLPEGMDLRLRISPGYLGPVEVRLYNILGMEAIRWNSLIATPSGANTLHVLLPPAVASGAYIAQIRIGQMTFNQRLFILK
jgi:hypothetical protein